MVRIRIVTPSYFQLTGLAATTGRVPTEADVGSHHIVVTEAFAASVLQGRHVQTISWDTARAEILKELEQRRAPRTAS
jgi:hypothetical protein